MPETLSAPPIYNAPPEQLRPEDYDTEAQFKREEFGLALVSKGLVDKEFYTSGAMDAFSLDKRTGRDALTHLLVGDERGGGHHLPTMMELGAAGTAVATKVRDPDNPSRPLEAFRRDQYVRRNGTYHALLVEVTDPRSGRTMNKRGGSSMFPNEWSTQDVLKSVIETSASPGTYDEVRGSYMHQKVVNGVMIRAATDEKTGKIITAYPLVAKR